ncbi:hypothetical protein PFISCL1PPCAC_9401, partial [Pristionchus fissidentatus]
ERRFPPSSRIYKKLHRCTMATTAVKNNGIRDSSNKLSSSTSDKRQKVSLKLDKSSSKSGKSAKGSKRSDKQKRDTNWAKDSSKKSKKESKSNSGRDGSKKKTKKSGASKSSKTKSLSRSETIKLSCGQDVYYVSARHFAACSSLIKKELAVNAHARSVDLTKFDKTTVRVLAEYIESKKIKTDISFYSLAELLKFSKVFEMDNLRAQLEKFITVIAANDLSTLHQVLLIIGITPVTRPTERVILERAAKQFIELATANTFQRVPFNVAITLFARCDLNVKSEVQVVDAMLLWLAGQPNLPSVGPALFYLVRHDFLHSIQKAFIIERARALRFPDDVVSMIDRCFECRNGARICVMREHYEAHYARCGIADPSQQDAKNPDMPLSLPREGILYKPVEQEPSNRKYTCSLAGFHSSEARPYYHHAPPACAGGKSKKSVAKLKSKTAAKKPKAAGAQKSSKSSKSSEKSGKSSRSGRKKGSVKEASSKSSKSAKGSKKSTKKITPAKPPPVTN